MTIFYSWKIERKDNANCSFGYICFIRIEARNNLEGLFLHSFVNAFHKTIC